MLASAHRATAGRSSRRWSPADAPARRWLRRATAAATGRRWLCGRDLTTCDPSIEHEPDVRRSVSEVTGYGARSTRRQRRLSSQLALILVVAAAPWLRGSAATAAAQQRPARA